MNIGKGLLTILLVIANLFAAVLMLLTFIASHVSPDSWLIPAYATLLLPALIPVNIFFVVLWMLWKKWYVLISLSVLLLNWRIIQNTIPLNVKSPESYQGDFDFSLMTYNTYANGMMKKHTKKSPNPVIRHILEEDPDILCIQEYSVNFSDTYLTEKNLMDIFKEYPYHHIHYKINTERSYFGNATFSKYPIINKQTVNFESHYNSAICSDINIKGKTIRIFNCHLESNYITEKDKVLAMRLRYNFDTDNLKGTTMHFSRKLGAAYRIRSKQAEIVSEQIKASPYPVMVVGDFNDLPSSYAYTTVRGDLQDAFVKKGFGLGWTFVDALLRFRIDHILYDPALELKSFKLDNNVRYSDHFPLTCKMAL